MVRDNIKFVGGGVTVYVATTGVKFNFTNSVKVINIPSTEETPNASQLLNLNKVEKRFTVNGSLSNGKLDVSETHTTAIDKRTALITMFGLGNVVVMTWESTAYDVAVDKYEIDYKSMDDHDDVSDGTMVYTTTISCVTGEDLI